MREGEFVGPSKGDDFDCLKLGKYEDIYIIQNGNYRSYCAKVFGISTVKTNVYKYEKVKNEYENKQVQELNCMKREFDNKDVLNSFYRAFRKRDIRDDEAKEHLKQDRTDLGLVKLLRI